MLNHLKNSMNVTQTENGAGALKSTGDDVLNFFAQGGALRNADENRILSLFTKAYAEDKLLAMKVLFYLRDIRLGQGERRTFETILRYLGDVDSEVVTKNLHLISEYGRWEDLYVLVGTKSENAVAELFKTQFESDMVSESPSLLGKWLKSANSKQKETRKLGLWTAKKLGLSETVYRKSLSSLRAKIDVVERKMVAKDWGNINYSGVPSKAMLTYRHAFKRNDEDRFVDYVDSVSKGEAKINAGAVYPYEIVEKVEHEMSNSFGGWDTNFNVEPTVRKVLNGMWESLPDFTKGSTENSIAVADVSGSMQGRPMHVSISLALYLAERAQGPYKNHFLTFSETPELVEVKGNDLVEKLANISKSNWGYSTDFEAIFDLLLQTAINNKLTQEEMIDRLYVITDMEFNQASRRHNETTLMRTMKLKFEEKGYVIPEVVFINVDSRNEHFPMEKHESGILMVSGMSPSIFSSVMSGEFVTAYDLMLNVVGSERYDAVTV